MAYFIVVFYDCGDYDLFLSFESSLFNDYSSRDPKSNADICNLTEKILIGHLVNFSWARS